MTRGGESAPASAGALLRGPADATLAFTARTFVNAKLRGIGELTDLEIDTAQRSARVRLILSGETEPLDVEVTRYDLERHEDGTWLVISEATSTRQWADAVLREFVVGRPLPLPASAGAVLGLLA